MSYHQQQKKNIRIIVLLFEIERGYLSLLSESEPKISVSTKFLVWISGAGLDLKFPSVANHLFV